MASALEQILRSRGLREPTVGQPGNAFSNPPTTTRDPIPEQGGLNQFGKEPGSRPIDAVAGELGMKPFEAWQLAEQFGDPQTLIREWALNGIPPNVLQGGTPGGSGGVPAPGGSGGGSGGGGGIPSPGGGVPTPGGGGGIPTPSGGSGGIPTPGDTGGGVGGTGGGGMTDREQRYFDFYGFLPENAPPTGGGTGGGGGTPRGVEPGTDTFPELPGGEEYPFRATPGYNFRFQEGQRAIENSAASRGGLMSGNTLKDLTRFGQGLAEQEFQNVFDMLGSLRGSGATQTISNAAGQTGANIGNLLRASGQARARGITEGNDALMEGFGGGLGILTSGLFDTGSPPSLPAGEVPQLFPGGASAGAGGFFGGGLGG